MNRSSARGTTAASNSLVQAFGIRFDLTCGDVRGSLISVSENPLLAPPQVRSVVCETLPAGLLRRIGQLELDRVSLSERGLVEAEITETTIRLCRQLLLEVGEQPRHLLALGVHGCQIWTIAAESRACFNLCDPSAVAEATGITVIDDFPARDLAQGGEGGPVEAHGLWLLLGDRTSLPGRRRRAVVHLADSLHVTILPPLDDWERTESTLSCDVGPGIRLLDELQARLVRGPGGSFDSGKIAVQGRVNHELVELWRCAATTTSRHGWHPHGVSVSPLLYALDSHDQLLRSMSLHDVFASATHLLAAQVADYIDHHVPPSHPVGELVLIGPGRKNLALVRELGRRLPVVSFCDAEQLAHDDNVLASSIAALTLLHLWQIPLRPSRGAEIPRILGRLTPGNPANWQGVLRVMNTHAPWLLPLREAI